MAPRGLHALFFGFVAVMFVVHLPLVFIVTHQHRVTPLEAGVSRNAVEFLPDVAVVGGLGAVETPHPTTAGFHKMDLESLRERPILFGRGFQKHLRRPDTEEELVDEEPDTDPPPEWKGLARVLKHADLVTPSTSLSLRTVPPGTLWPAASGISSVDEENLLSVVTPLPSQPLPSPMVTRAYTVDESFAKPQQAMPDASLTDRTVDVADIDATIPASSVTLTSAGVVSSGGGVRSGQRSQLAVLFYIGDESLCPSTLLEEIDRATPPEVATELIVIGGDERCLKAAAQGGIHRIAHVRFFRLDVNLDPRIVMSPAEAAKNKASKPPSPVPNPWTILPKLVECVSAPYFTFVGPSVQAIGPGLFRALFDALVPAPPAEQPALMPHFNAIAGDGSAQGPTIVACTVRSALLPSGPSLPRAGAEFIVSRALGALFVSGENIVLDEHAAGLSAEDARAAILDKGVAPSPYCFATSVHSVRTHWPHDSATPKASHSPGSPLPIEHPYDTFVDMTDGDASDAADHVSHPGLQDAHLVAELHGSFLVYALTAGAASAAAGQVHVVPCVTQHVSVFLPAWTPTGPSDPATVDPLSLTFPATVQVSSIKKWLIRAATPSRTIEADAAGASGNLVAAAAPRGVVWDTFCVRCFGFSNEVMHFAVPLEKRIPMSLQNRPDCFCPGTPRSFSASLRRMASPNRFSANRRPSPLLEQSPAPGAPKSFADLRPLIWVTHKDPGSFVAGLRSKSDIVVGRAMYEFSKLPVNWKGKDRLVDEIWVPSRYVRYVFEDAGFDKSKLIIMPEPIDVYQYDPAVVRPFQLPLRHRGWKYATNRPSSAPILLDGVEAKTGTVFVPRDVAGLRRHFKFFSVFKWEGRKAWDVLLRAFFKEFAPHEKVSLYLVSYVYGRTGRDPDAMLSMAEGIASSLPGAWPTNVPHIEIISEELSEADLIGMYRSVDAFVLPTRGEGWGLPIIQAMAMALPTIATNFSGQTDFMTNDTSYLLPFDALRELPSGSEYGAQPGKVWAEPSELALRRLMRHVFEHRTEALMRGLRARAHVVKHYSDEAISELVLQRLDFLSRRYAEAHHEKRSGADALLHGHDKGLFP